ncbi:MAG: 2Fe-2S iron-sulfur cluster-binding protein [Candidatus Izemoplasmatales bacterium]|jgi:carbon-monoxide dehydrogenase small subunit|nr:2Fe-2S iron-sulfur cluster-binding protein [Candidatus Izemoplasmatales bacterium]MDD4595385.1 2Fe-2S iron-sulfur cluster-binding protein [Candidatus Izemoplasmatales bacterium]
MKIELTLNGRKISVDILPGEYLIETLRKCNIHSVRRGCDTTNCGVCTILLDGKPVPSCSVLSAQADHHQITTIEGIAHEAEKLSTFFGKEGADQCGYCNPALALSVYALMKENPHPTSAEIDEYLIGNLCRCSGYKNQNKAIMAFLAEEARMEEQ